MCFAEIRPLRGLYSPNRGDWYGIPKRPVIPRLSATRCFGALRSRDILSAHSTGMAHKSVGSLLLCSDLLPLYGALCHHGNTDTNYSHSVSLLACQADLTWPFVDLNWRTPQVQGPSGVLTFLPLFSLLSVIVVSHRLRNMCPCLNPVQFPCTAVAGYTGSIETRLFIIVVCTVFSLEVSWPQ